MIEIKNLSRNWKEFSLNIDLHIEEGEYFVILGPTASGKTLLLELIAGFYHPDSGSITIDKTDVADLLPEQRKIGFVYQDYSIFPHLNVEENIEFGLKLKKTPRDERRRRVQEIMDLLGISHLSHRYSLTLSGGEQQRVSLARAIIVDPGILLLDEPLSALDNQTQNMLRVMIRGWIVQVGTPEEIFNSPANAEIAEFVGTENILAGIVVSNEGGLATIEVGAHVVEAVSGYSAGEHVRVCLRPEDVFVSVGAVAFQTRHGDRDHRESSVRNAFHGTVTQMMPYGALTRVKIDCGAVVVALITKQSAAAMGLTEGSRVCVSFKAAAVHVIGGG